MHINDGSDGTLDWANTQQLLYTHSPNNIGICYAVNQAAALAQMDYIVYMNDDMYCLPQWDIPLVENINALNHHCFMFSATMIEPSQHNNPCVLVKNYGSDLEHFEEEKILKEYQSLEFKDWNGSAWPPTLVHKYYWHLVGGYSVELSPGMSSDDDFAMKMWQAGCRIFKGIAASRVYHFQAKSTGRIVKNKGSKQFLRKWNIAQSTFNRYFIKRGSPFQGPLPEPDPFILKKEKWRAWLKNKWL